MGSKGGKGSRAASKGGGGEEVGRLAQHDRQAVGWRP